MPGTFYADRTEAGKALAQALMRELSSTSLGRPLVLAIPRGGVVVAKEVAEALDADLDVVVPRKLGAEGNPEYAIGAVMQDGTTYLNPEALRVTGATERYIDSVKKKEMAEASRRLLAYRGRRKEPELSGRVVVVVDDGIATGATMIAALRWARSKGASMLIAAAPVGPPSTVEELKDEADMVVCPMTPEPFYAIGQFYQHFDQVTDKEVEKMLTGPIAKG